MSQSYYGKHRGVVVDSDDPAGRARLMVQVPSVLGSQQVWAMPCLPCGGPYAVPRPGAHVWVEFEAGDSARPIWTGCFWPDGEVPRDNHCAPAIPGIDIVRHGDETTITPGDQGQQVTVEVRQGAVTIRGAAKVVMDALQIDLAEGATHPLVRGDALLAYLSHLVAMLNAHVHPDDDPGATPPDPPLPPPDPSLLSERVNTG